MRALYHYIGLWTWQDAAWYRSLTDPNTIEDIEAFISEHRQHHPQVPDDQGEASHMMLEELSTLEEENITEGQNEDDGVIGDQLADALDLIQNMVSANINDERVKKPQGILSRRSCMPKN